MAQSSGSAEYVGQIFADFIAASSFVISAHNVMAMIMKSGHSMRLAARNRTHNTQYATTGNLYSNEARLLVDNEPVITMDFFAFSPLLISN